MNATRNFYFRSQSVTCARNLRFLLSISSLSISLPSSSSSTIFSFRYFHSITVFYSIKNASSLYFFIIKHVSVYVPFTNANTKISLTHSSTILTTQLIDAQNHHTVSFHPTLGQSSVDLQTSPGNLGASFL